MFSSDAGEPSGSAGLPVLNAIRSSGLDYVMVVVVRYFGGVLLGIKGLIDAYNSVARKTLEVANKGGDARLPAGPQCLAERPACPLVEH